MFLGIGLGIKRFSAVLTSIVSSNLQMWLGFTKVNVIGKELLPLAGSITNANDAVMERLTENNYSAGSDGIQTSTARPRLDIATTAGSTYNVIITPNPNSTPTGTIKGKLYDGSGYVLANYDFTTVKEVTFKSNGSVNFNFNGTYAFDTGEFSVSVKEISQFTPDKSINTNEAKLFTGKALTFNGNDYVDLGTTFGLTGEFTVAFWVNLNSYVVVPIGDVGNDDWIRFDSETAMTVKVAGTSTGYAAVTTGGNVPLNQWSRVAITRQSDNIIRFIVNGIIYEPSASVRTGAFDFNRLGVKNGGNFFNGLLSDVQIYNAAWNSDDAAYDYANPNNLATDNPSTSLTLSNLSAYYALSEGSGNVIFDSTGLGAELVTNGDFSDGETGWNFTLPWSIVDNQATTPGTSDGVIQKIDQTSLVNGSNRLTFDIIEGEAQVYTNYPVFSSKGTFSTVGTHTIDLDSDGLDTGSSSNGKDNRLFFIYNKATNVSLTVDNISVKLVKADDGTGAFLNTTPAVIGATWVDNQPTIPQLGMMDWSKGSNLIAFSDDVTGTGWSTPSDGDDGVDPVVTLNHGISPTGVKNAARVVFDIGSSTISADFSQLQYSITVEDEKDYNTSLYIKSNDSNDYTLAFLDIDGTRTNITANQSWQRYNVSGTAIDTSQFFKLRIRGSESTSKNANVLIYGPQITLGALGSYIATAGFPASNATLIQNPNDLGKDVLGNALRLRDGGFNLDGIGYADVADDASLDFGTGNFSIETWVNIQSSANGELISKIASNVGFKLNSTPGGTGEWLFQVNDGSSPHTYTYSNASFVGVGWCHISAVVDRSKNKIDLYFDSSLSNGNTGGQNLGDLGNVSNSTLLRIAKGANVADGLIDELRLYNRALTHKEIINNYKAGLSKHS